MIQMSWPFLSLDASDCVFIISPFGVVACEIVLLPVPMPVVEWTVGIVDGSDTDW